MSSRTLKIAALFLVTSCCCMDGAENGVGARSPVPLPPYAVEDTLVRGFTISYGVKYFLWGPVDDATFEDVDAGSLPAKAGVKSGDRILKVNGKPVREMKRKEMEQTLFRNGVTVNLEVQSPGSPPRKVELSWPAISWDPKLTKK
jgi:membrane-associated protease RseP (regulator of RpoE activity)